MRSERLRRAIHGARLLLTSVERTQGLTAATASALVSLASSLELWCDRRRAAELFPAMAQAELLLLLRADGGRREKAQATEGREWSGGAGRRPDQGEGVVGRGAPNAGVRPPRGRRRMWRGGRRARERERRGRQAGLLAGPKGRRVGPAAPVPFSFFFEILFSNFF